MKAYKTYSQCPSDRNPNNIPSNIPWQVQECSEDEKILLESQGFTVVGDSEYQNVVTVSESSNAAWFSSQLAKIPDVTPRQIRIKLLYLGITEATIDGVINTLPSPQKEAAMITWKYSTAFERHNALVPVIAAMLAYNDAQLDQIWLDAGKL